MAINYAHSTVMSIVKSTDEKIKHNYSSSQYMEVLDTLLNNAIQPILNSTYFVDVFVSGVVHHYTENARRKITQVHKDKFLARSILFLSSDIYRKPQLYKKLRIERSITNTIVKRFITATQEYIALKRKYSLSPSQEIAHKISHIEKSVLYEGDIDFCAIVREVCYWQDKYCEFKNMILQKYMRLISKQAQNYYAQHNSSIELDDLIQNYVLYASKAIDKFDQRQGTLTSYIMNWLNHARNITAANESGTAFTLPPNKRRERKINNTAVSLDADEVQQLEVKSVEDLEKESDRERIRELAKLADPDGLARMSLGIQEVLSSEDIERIKQYELVVS